MNNKYDRQFFGMPPSFQIADDVFYITRGRKESMQQPPLTYGEWLKAVNNFSQLSLDETYLQQNIHLEKDELCWEQGRTRWEICPNNQPEWLHYSLAGIDYLHEQVFKGGKQHDRYQQIRRNLKDNPSLKDWCDYVENDPWMVLDDKSNIIEPGRALWLNRKGETKYVFRYMPSSVWIHTGWDTETSHNLYKNKRLKLCKKLADFLACELWHGRNKVIYHGA